MRGRGGRTRSSASSASKSRDAESSSITEGRRLDPTADLTDHSHLEIDEDSVDPFDAIQPNSPIASLSTSNNQMTAPSTSAASAAQIASRSPKGRRKNSMPPSLSDPASPAPAPDPLTTLANSKRANPPRNKRKAVPVDFVADSSLSDQTSIQATVSPTVDPTTAATATVAPKRRKSSILVPPATDSPQADLSVTTVSGLAAPTNTSSPLIVPSPNSPRIQRKLLLLKSHPTLHSKFAGVDSRVKELLALEAFTSPIPMSMPLRKHQHDIPSYRWVLSPPDPLTGIRKVIKSVDPDPVRCVKIRTAAVLKSKVKEIPATTSFARYIYGDERLRHTLTCPRESFTSPFTGKQLPRYIQRDLSMQPPAKQWLELIASKRRFDESHNSSGAATNGVVSSPPPSIPPTSIDFVYLQPGHVHEINDVLRRLFWPGIDVSEHLRFPDFSVVAMYKRLVVGCGLMTPNGYITYFMVRPGWTHVGIARYMLYVLLNSNPNVDITLHVAANNPALILYQSFGFKAEEFIIKFYDKYINHGWTLNESSGGDDKLESYAVTTNALRVRLKRR